MLQCFQLTGAKFLPEAPQYDINFTCVFPATQIMHRVTRRFNTPGISGCVSIGSCKPIDDVSDVRVLPAPLLSPHQIICLCDRYERFETPSAFLPDSPFAVHAIRCDEIYHLPHSDSYGATLEVGWAVCSLCLCPWYLFCLFVS
jgi:hypothetical protein